MIGHYDCFIQLLTFRNIDLPLQGVYFIQLKLEKSSFPNIVIPYSASTQGQNSLRLHRLFPPQVSIEDAMQSTGFVIQFSDEEIGLSDSYRVSIKESIRAKVDCGKIKFHAASVDMREPLSLKVDLLFSNAEDKGGLDKIILAPDSSEFPTEFTIVASQTLLLQAGNSSQYFRTPLGLIREHITEEAEADERESGDIFPCAFLEGVFMSSLVKLDLGAIETGIDYFQQRSRELEVHVKDIQEAVVGFLSDTLRSHQQLVMDLEIDNILKKGAIEEEMILRPLSDFVGTIDHLSTRLFVGWTRILDNFPKRIRKGRFKVHWREAITAAARKYLQDGLRRDSNLRFTVDPEQLFYRMERNRMPVVFSDNITPETMSSKGHGSHLVILVHGYQGSPNDMRIIRNTIAFVCPDVIILSSSSNEDQTDGDIQNMGIRLSMEVRDFISKHSSSFFVINRISFVCHSLGGLIVRSALPHLMEFKDRFHWFLSLSTPHAGVANKLLESGIIFLNLFKKSEVLHQLLLKDTQDVNQTFLFTLSEAPGLGWFKRITFVGSHQDQYAPLSSAILSTEAADESIPRMIFDRLSTGIHENRFVRMNVHFEIPRSSPIDNMLGRAAHIKFLECPMIIQLIFLLNNDLVEI
jgi:hypothetical protein